MSGSQRDCGIIAEVEFNPLYEDQPLFSRVASKSVIKRLCRLMCGKPRAFRRRLPLVCSLARLEGSAFQPSQGG
jgi:hypothetical protein